MIKVAKTARMMFVGFAIATCVVSITLATSRAEARALDPISSDEMKARLEELQHIPWAGKALETDDGWLSSCHRSNIEIQVGDAKTGEVFKQNLILIRPDTSAAVPAMVVVPTIEGLTMVERSVASKFCDAGIASIIADVNDNKIPDVMPSWGIEDGRNRRSILALRAAVDFATSTAYFDQKKVGMMGLSLGAISSAFMAGIEPDRLAAIVTVLAGGDLPYVLSVSDNAQVADLRQQRMDHEKINTAEDYENVLRVQLRYDPMYFTSQVNRSKIFMVLSDNDTKVPTIVQRDLFKAFGEPSSTTFTTGHVQTVISLTYFYFDYVTNFVRERFGMKKPSSKRFFHERIENPRVIEGLTYE